jgi:hypothetical protein
MRQCPVIFAILCGCSNIKERDDMAEKLSKTARASLGDKGAKHEHNCPECDTVMVATKIIKYRNTPGGMFWVCPKDDHRIKIN